MTKEDRQEMISQYEAGYSEIEQALEEFPHEHLTAHPIPGKWSACEIVQHLADSEMRGAIRLRQLLTENRPQIQSYDQDAYAERLYYNARTDIAPALDAFRGARATTLQLFSRMTEEDWLREGCHPEHETYTAEKWLEIYAVHAHEHARQIRRLKEAMELTVRS